MHQRIMPCRPITRHLMRYAASCGMIDQQVCDRGAGIAKTFPQNGKLIDMCTLVILRRPEHPWPVVIAANRDEMIDREWRAPAHHWPDRPETVGGLDVLAGGSWLAVHEYGVAAGLLNPVGSLRPPARRPPRGELVPEAGDHARPRIRAPA